MSGAIASKLKRLAPANIDRPQTHYSLPAVADAIEPNFNLNPVTVITKCRFKGPTKR
jgi:hypothetical protein